MSKAGPTVPTGQSLRQLRFGIVLVSLRGSSETTQFARASGARRDGYLRLEPRAYASLKLPNVFLREGEVCVVRRSENN